MSEVYLDAFFALDPLTVNKSKVTVLQIYSICIKIITNINKIQSSKRLHGVLISNHFYRT